MENSVSTTSPDTQGAVIVKEKVTGNFLYQISPGPETRVVFRKPDGEECPAIISDREIRLGGLVVENGLFNGTLGGVLVDPQIGAGMLGVPLPQQVIGWLS